MDALRRRIIHTLSHEFRTPLVSINTGTELLIDQVDELDKKDLKNLLESILRGGQRLERLVDDFMLLQQLDLGHAEEAYKNNKKVYSVHRLIEQSIESFIESLSEKNQSEVKINFHKDTSDALVCVHDLHIVNVFERILSNAIKFAGIDKPVDIFHLRECDTVQIVIRDYGPGLPENSSENVFEPFIQVNREVREQQGCGFGLAIASSLIKVNQGSLELRPAKDQHGLEVIILIPATSDKLF